MTQRRATFVKLLGTTALCLWGSYWQLLAFITVSSARFSDFGRFYYAARQWREGASLYSPSVATWVQLHNSDGVHLWNLNPPHVSLIFLPLTLLEVNNAYAVWTLVTFFCLAFSAKIIVDTLGARPAAASLALAAAFVFASTPTLAYVSTGNVTGPVALLITWTWQQWRLGRAGRTAIGIGAAWSAKLFFLPLVLYLFTKREWRAGLLAIAAGCALFALGISVFGWTEQVEWSRAMAGVQWPWLAMNSSVFAPLARAAFVAHGESIAAPEIVAAIRVGIATAAVLAVLGIATAWRDPNRDRSFLTITVTCLLTFPLGWLYYWWVFAGPLVASWRWRPVRRGFWWSLPGWLIPMSRIWPYGSVTFAVTVGSIYTWSLLVLWLGVVVSAWTDALDAPPTGLVTSPRQEERTAAYQSPV